MDHNFYATCLCILVPYTHFCVECMCLCSKTEPMSPQCTPCGTWSTFQSLLHSFNHIAIAWPGIHIVTRSGSMNLVAIPNDTNQVSSYKSVNSPRQSTLTTHNYSTRISIMHSSITSIKVISETNNDNLQWCLIFQLTLLHYLLHQYKTRTARSQRYQITYIKSDQNVALFRLNTVTFRHTTPHLD